VKHRCSPFGGISPRRASFEVEAVRERVQKDLEKLRVMLGGQLRVR